MIKLKRAYEPAAAEDGRRFLVDRVWPRGRRREELEIEAWLKEVSPSTALRTWYGHDPARWPEFAQRFHRELEARPEALAPLLAAARSGDVTLVYSARDEQRNQAVVIKQLLEQRLQRGRGKETGDG